MKILPIKNYEGSYEVSDDGSVFSCERRIIRHNKWGGNDLYPVKRRKLKVDISQRGYCLVSLYKDKKSTKCSIHRLVALTFLPNPLNLPEVLHKDNNKQNNNVSNLKWGTVIENAQDAYRDGLSKHTFEKGEKHLNAKLTDEKVEKILKMVATGKYTHKELGNMFNVSGSAIDLVVTGKRWKHLFKK